MAAILLLCSVPGLYAQTFFKARIVDASSGAPVPFAMIAAGSSHTGVTADLDGYVEMQLPAGTEELLVHMIGYEKKTVYLEDTNPDKVNVIQLNGSGVALAEVVIMPGENPAHAIIDQVIRNKPRFDISNLPQYFCRTYAKTYFTFASRDGQEWYMRKDQPSPASGAPLTNAYLFFMESVTEKKYHYKNQAQEKVTATRVSGFKSAPFGAFASQLQSFAFYDDQLDIMGLRYVNPLSPGTFKRYQFEITDTLLNGTDTTFIIRFAPKAKTSFKGLKGLLYIYKNQYVLTNVLAEPAEIPQDGSGVKIQQLYGRIDSLHWFPKQANTEILFYGSEASTLSDSLGRPAIIKGVSRVYIRDVRLDTAVSIRQKSLASYHEDGFDQKNESFWQQHRQDSLNTKERKTYRVMDSLGAKHHFDSKLKWFAALGSGQFQLGYVSLDLKHLFRVNDYEQLRLGMGLVTSNKLSRYFSLGGYGGYGFGDKAWKYGGHMRVNFDALQTTYLQAELAREVMESAGTVFLQENGSFLSTAGLRELLVNRMDQVSYGKLSFNCSPLRALRTSAYVQVQQRQSPFGYADTYNNLLLNERSRFTFNEAGMQFKFWPHEKFAETMGSLASLGSRWPVFFLNLSHGFRSELAGYAGDFEYTRIDLRVDHQHYFRVKGFLAWQVQAGKVFGDVPYSIQYNNKSSRSDRYWVSIEKTFETMYLNEFVSSQYAALFLAVNSGKLFRPIGQFSPELELVHNYGIGTLDNRQRITNIELNDMRKGYSEAGLRVKGILQSSFSALGLGVYYRYGAYAAEQMKKNFVYKLVLSFSF